MNLRTTQNPLVSRSELLHRHRFRKIPRLVDVAASSHGDVVGEELEGDYFEQGEEELGGGGDVNGVLDEPGDVLVARDGDDASEPGSARGLARLDTRAGVKLR